MSLQHRVIATLCAVRDPEMPVNIYDLGLIYGVETNPEGSVFVRMTLTAPNCPVAETLFGEVDRAVRAIPGVTDVHVELTFDPPWSRDRMSPAARLFLGMEDTLTPLVNIRL